MKDGEFGKAYVPESHLFCGYEGYGRYRHDELGFNNDEGIAQSTNTPRILVLGDSFTKAEQISRENNFCSRLQQQLSKAEQKINVINLGMSGNAIAEYIHYAPVYLKKFNPQYVIIQFTIEDFTNDATDSSKNIHMQIQNSQFQVVKSSPSRLKNWKNQLIAFSPLTTYFYLKFPREIWSNEGSWLHRFVSLSCGRGCANLTPSLSKSVLSYRAKDNISFLSPEKNVALIKWELQQLKNLYGEKLILLHTPRMPQIENHQIVLTEENPLIDELKKLCTELQIPVADPSSQFIELYQTQHKFPRGFNNSRPGSGHFNESGHQILANVLFEYLNQIKPQTPNPKSQTNLKSQFSKFKT
ncbi:MAG: SGNH/GDSL hydrolase family protein [Verrucomicrobiota bacterium]